MTDAPTLKRLLDELVGAAIALGQSTDEHEGIAHRAAVEELKRRIMEMAGKP